MPIPISFLFFLFQFLIFSLVNKIMATKQLNDVIPVFGPNMFIFSYCVYEENEEKQKQCINDNFPNGAWKLQKSEVLECDLMGNSCAYLLAINEEMRQIVIAFRGTTTIKQTFDQIWHGLANRCIPFGGNGNEGASWEKGFVNKYFYEALIGEGKGKSMWDRIVEQIEKLVQKCYATVIFTGHSLGGALASLASLLLFERKISRTVKIAHFSYGQPRVGCAQFAKYFEKNIKFSFRFVHRHDIIAAIPPENMKCVQCNTQGYKHHGISIPFQSQNVPCLEKCRNPMDCTKCDHNSAGISLRIINILGKWHIPRFMTDHFEYFNFNVKNKVHILTLMDFTRLNFMKRIRIFVRAVLDIMKNCFGINEPKKFGIDSSMIDG